jgi:hypothetical protein
MMTFNYSTKIKIVIGLIILIALESNILDCLTATKSFRGNDGDEVTQYDQRLGRLKSILPPHGVVGYITDGKFDSKAFYLTQYALSPAFVVRGREPQLIVAHFSNPVDHVQFCTSNRLLLVKDVGDNVFLFRKNVR